MMHKIKPLFGVALSTLFVMQGFYLFFEKSGTVDPSNATFIKIVGIICIVAFGGLLLVGIKKVIKKADPNG